MMARRANILTLLRRRGGIEISTTIHYMNGTSRREIRTLTPVTHAYRRRDLKADPLRNMQTAQDYISGKSDSLSKRLA
jgi:hypothetical protein